MRWQCVNSHSTDFKVNLQLETTTYLSGIFEVHNRQLWQKYSQNLADEHHRMKQENLHICQSERTPQGKLLDKIMPGSWLGQVCIVVPRRCAGQMRNAGLGLRKHVEWCVDLHDRHVTSRVHLNFTPVCLHM